MAEAKTFSVDRKQIKGRKERERKREGKEARKKSGMNLPKKNKFWLMRMR